MLKSIVISFVLIFFAGFVIGQEFTEDREKFVKEFNKTLSDFGQGDYSKFTKKELPLLLVESADCSDELFKKMVKTSNLILEKRLKPYPELYDYVFSIYSLVKSNQTKESVTAWHNTVDNMLDARNVKKFKDFIELSSSFFSESIITRQSNYTWYYEGGKFSFDSDGKAFFILTGGNLVCRVENRNDKDAKKNPYIDSVVVYETEGIFDPFLKRWEGKEGTITWEKAGLSKNTTYAKVKTYEIALKSSNFSADSVLFHTPLFAKPILGLLTDRAFISSRSDDKVFPQFLSYDKKLEIKNIKKGMDYVGGIAMKGADFEGFGTKSDPAILTVYQENKPFIVAKSELFVVNDVKIYSKEANFWMALAEKDSIAHPGATLIYSVENHSFEIQRSTNGVGQAPFNNSYHEVDMYIPKIVWVEGIKVLNFEFSFGMSQDQRVARLESNNYFNARQYGQIQGLSSTHPLVSILDYSYKNDKQLIPEGAAASALGKTVDQTKSLLLDLASQGFINYDTEQKVISVNQKTVNFVEARSEKRDYDNLVFISDLRPKTLREYSPEQIAADPFLQAVKTNYDLINADRAKMKNFGKLDLKTMDLYFTAVDQITISETQQVVAFPKNFDVTIKKNRDFDFSGYINAGKMEVDADISDFRYNEFKFNLTKTNNTNFRVRPMAEQDGNRAIEIKSKLNGIVGELLVDDPTNRSGKNKKFNFYPKLNSIKDAKIFYNDKSIYRGAYDSSRFFFTVQPFELDSLDDFDEKSFYLNGELTSAGIFPKFKEQVRIMPDYSLGFSKQAPKGGYSFYSSSANYDNKIILSNSGLQGAGTIKFLKASAVSKALAFLPDSTLGYAEFVNEIQETGVQFPKVTGKEILVTYIPGQNLLKAQSSPKDDLNFFDGQAILKGTAYITPKGMRGEGLMNFLTATLVSKDFAFKAHEITGDTTDFNMRNTNNTGDENNITFKTDNVSANISFKDRKGVFVSNGGSSSVAFPINEFICKMDIFNWFMDQDKIDMESKGEDKIAFDAGVDIATPNFFSTNKKQDSLMFKAPKATYSIKEKVIYCDAIDFIDIADARISPSDKKLTIRKNAKIDLLPEAKIVANYITKYHTFVKAKVEITGRRAYTAVGDYPYFDSEGNLFFVPMSKIGLDTSYQTIATGEIAQEQGFHLSDKFDFYGNLIIRASKPLVEYKGATKLNHTCTKFERNWLAFDAEIDPQAIQIPVAKEMRNLDGDRISAGIVWRDSRSTDSIRIYPTFLSSVYDKNDPVVLTASGVLQYDQTTKEFQIGPKAKFLNPTEKGNIIVLNSETCSMKGSGLIDLGMNYGDVALSTFGTASYDQNNGLTSMDVTMNIQMKVETKPFEEIAERIQLVPGIPFMDIEEANIEQALVEWESAVVADKFKSDYVIKGEVKKLPESLSKGITFTGLKLQSFDYNREQERGLITSSREAVLVNIFDKPVFKEISVDAFFQKTFSDAQSDKFSVLFSVTGGSLYFMDYSMAKKDGELRMMSSDSEFKKAIDDLKPEKRKSKNFSYGFTDQNVYIVKFKRLLGLEEE
jgi:hypothetical protein